MLMLPHHVEVSLTPDGLPAVEATFDLTAAQAGAAAHALHVIRDVRYRTTELSTDEVLSMREMTALGDELSALQARGAIDHVRATVARLGILRSAIDEFLAGDHLEREGDAEARPIVFTLADAVADLHAEALQAVLNGPAGVR
jgi:hypothetical protein